MRPPSFLRQGMLLVCVIAAMLPGAPARALGLGLTVTPGKVDLDVQPGETYTIGLIVRNQSDDAVHVAASQADFALDSQGAYEYGVPSPTSSRAWFAVTPREFDLPAQDFQQVQFTLRVPKTSALNGEYAGVLFMQTRPGRGRVGLAFSARVAVKVYATIAQTGKVSGAVTTLSAAPSGEDERYHIAFRNTGNRHLYVGGKLEVRRGGSVLQTLALPPALLVERGGERAIDLSGPRLPPGSYEAVAILEYGGATRTGGRIRFDAQ